MRNSKVNYDFCWPKHVHDPSGASAQGSSDFDLPLHIFRQADSALSALLPSKHREYLVFIFRESLTLTIPIVDVEVQSSKLARTIQ